MTTGNCFIFDFPWKWDVASLVLSCWFVWCYFCGEQVQDTRLLRETMSVCGKEWRHIILPCYCQIPDRVTDQVDKMCARCWCYNTDFFKRHTLVLVRPELYRLDSQYKFGVSSRIGSIHLYFTEDGAKWLGTCVLSRLAYCSSLLLGTPNSGSECRKSKILLHTLFSKLHALQHRSTNCCQKWWHHWSLKAVSWLTSCLCICGCCIT